jgi:hypothetical protein
MFGGDYSKLGTSFLIAEAFANIRDTRNIQLLQSVEKKDQKQVWNTAPATLMARSLGIGRDNNINRDGKPIQVENIDELISDPNIDSESKLLLKEWQNMETEQQYDDFPDSYKAYLVDKKRTGPTKSLEEFLDYMAKVEEINSKIEAKKREQNENKQTGLPKR